MEKARILVILYNNVKPSNYYYNPLMGKRNGVLNMKKILSFGIALTVGISFGVSAMNKNLAELPPVYQPQTTKLLVELPPVYKPNLLKFVAELPPVYKPNSSVNLAADFGTDRELPPVY